jgi:hypothetical protein
MRHNVGDTVTLPVAWNSNGVERTNVTGRIVGFRALLVILDTATEGVWGYATDIINEGN